MTSTQTNPGNWRDPYMSAEERKLLEGLHLGGGAYVGASEYKMVASLRERGLLNMWQVGLTQRPTWKMDITPKGIAAYQAEPMTDRR